MSEVSKYAAPPVFSAKFVPPMVKSELNAASPPPLLPTKVESVTSIPAVGDPPGSLHTTAPYPFYMLGIDAKMAKIDETKEIVHIADCHGRGRVTHGKSNSGEGGMSLGDTTSRRSF